MLKERENIHTLHLLNRFFDYLFKSIEAGVKFYMLWNYKCLNHYYMGGEILEDWKIEISVLWLFYMVAFVAVMMLGIMQPGVLSQFLDTGEIGGMKIGPEVLLLLAI